MGTLAFYCKCHQWQFNGYGSEKLLQLSSCRMYVRDIFSSSESKTAIGEVYIIQRIKSIVWRPTTKHLCWLCLRQAADLPEMYTKDPSLFLRHWGMVQIVKRTRLSRLHCYSGDPSCFSKRPHVKRCIEAMFEMFYVQVHTLLSVHIQFQGIRCSVSWMCHSPRHSAIPYGIESKICRKSESFTIFDSCWNRCQCYR